MNKSSFPPTALSAKQACHSKGKGKNLVTTAHFGLSALYFKDTRQINHKYVATNSTAVTSASQ